MSGCEVAELSQQNAGSHVGQHMLARGQRGDADSDGSGEREAAISRGYILSPSDSDPAEPADKTMNGGKQVVCGVNLIEQLHKTVPYRTAADFRTDVCSRKEDKNQKTDEFGQCVRAEKTVAFSAILPGAQIVIDAPEQVTAEINGYGPWQKRNQQIDGAGHIIMGPCFCDEPAEQIDASVQKKGGDQDEGCFERMSVLLNGMLLGFGESRFAA